jgi:hypothetical protein
MLERILIAKVCEFLRQFALAEIRRGPNDAICREGEAVRLPEGMKFEKGALGPQQARMQSKNAAARPFLETRRVAT